MRYIYLDKDSKKSDNDIAKINSLIEEEFHRLSENTFVVKDDKQVSIADLKIIPEKKEEKWYHKVGKGVGKLANIISAKMNSLMDKMKTKWGTHNKIENM